MKNALTRFWGLSWWIKGPTLAVSALIVIGTIGAIAGGGDENKDKTASEVTERPASPTVDDDSKPTDQPRATPVPTPELTTSPAPTPQSPSLEILSSTPYTDTISAYHVAGEIRNNSSDYMQFVEVVGTFFNAAGQVVASESTFTSLDIVSPGEAAAFEIVILDGATLGISRYELAAQGDDTSDRPAQGLVIQGDTSNIDAINAYHVVGQILNQSSNAYEFVEIIGTFYSGEGTVVRTDSTYTQLDQLPPGGSSSFDLVVLDGGSAGIANYKLVVEGSTP